MTRKARGLWFESPRNAVLRDEEIPPPAPDEVQVRALHSLVSAGTELRLYRGESSLPNLINATARGVLPFPVKLAYQTVGEVVVAGAQTGFDVGQVVFAAHPHQDIFNVPAIAPYLIALPEGTDPLRAGFSMLFQVALHTFLQHPLRPGDFVAVSGLGIIGQFSAYLARLSAAKLIVVDPLPLRREMAAWIGADAVVNPDDANDVIQDLTKGCGVDVFVETSGAPAALQLAICNTATLGTVAIPALYGAKEVKLSLSPEFHLRSLKILSIQMKNLDEDDRWDIIRRFMTSLHFLEKINVQALVTHRIPFAQAPDAYRLLDEHPDTALAVILDY